MELAPILVSVYNRKKHFNNCIEALKNNELSSESILYIVSDAAYREEDKKIIEEIRESVNQIKGFKEVIGIFREENQGSHRSILGAIGQVVDKHGKIIFLEDDIIASKYFLKFMNECLEKFKDRKEIFGACAYSYPDFEVPKSYDKDVYLWGYYCPWGIATWKDRWEKLDFEIKDFNDFLKDKKQVYKFFRGAEQALGILMASIKRGTGADDARIEYNLFRKNMKCIFPVKSLAKNSGADGSGETLGENKKYSEHVLENFNPIIHLEVGENSEITEARRKYHRISFRGRVAIFLKVFEMYDFVAPIWYKIRGSKSE